MICRPVGKICRLLNALFTQPPLVSARASSPDRQPRNSTVNGFIQLIRNLGPARLLTLALIAAGTIAFFYYLIGKVNTPEMGLLYSDLDLKDSGQIVQKLESHERALRAARRRRADPGAGRPGRPAAHDAWPRTACRMAARSATRSSTRPTRSAPRNFVAEHQSGPRSRRRARAHHQFDQPRAVGARPSRAAATRAVLARPPGAERLDRAANARRRTLSQRPGRGDPAPRRRRRARPQAQSRLDRRRSRATCWRAATAMRGCRPPPRNAEEMRVNYENRLARTVEELLERSVGAGKVRVEVHAEMDFDRITTNSESYDPDGQVVRSTQTDDRVGADSSNTSGAAVTVADQPARTGRRTKQQRHQAAARARTPRGDGQLRDQQDRQEPVREAGTVKRLSVAVLVDGTYDGRRRRQANLSAALARGAEAAHRRSCARAVGYRREARRHGRSRQHALRRRRRAAPAAPAAFNLIGPRARRPDRIGAAPPAPR